MISSLVWGSCAAGFIMYGKKQGSTPALCGGIALLGVSCIPVIWGMWFAGSAVIAGTVWAQKQGY